MSFLDKPFADARLQPYSEMDGHVEEGMLMKTNDEWVPIVDGVPCFLQGDLRPDFSAFAKKHGLPFTKVGGGKNEHQEQAKTNVTFSDKWRRFRSYGLESSHQQFLQGWYCKKLGLSDTAALRQFYQSKQRILEVGPGSGFNTRFMAENCPGTVFAADVSDAAFTTYQNTKHLSNCHVVQADVMDLPFADGTFDFAIADGVLHHTPNTRKAVEALYRKVKPGGQFFFYVYKQMGAARRFCDDFIRANFTKLSTEDCYAACEGLTELGRELSKLQAKITLTKPIPVLDIPAGTHDVQRLLYYNFVKCFWNDAFDYETNNMVNFDWYHPHNAWQHTQTEVTSWLEELGVNEFAFHDANPNGLSVLLRKPASMSCREAA
jgi:SAM-dependent methyltransferase